MSLHARYLQQAAWTRDLRAYLFDRVEWRSALTPGFQDRITDLSRGEKTNIQVGRDH